MKKKIAIIILSVIIVSLLSTNFLFASENNDSITFEGNIYTIHNTQSLYGRTIIVEGNNEKTVISSNILDENARMETTINGETTVTEFDKNIGEKIRNTQYSEAKDHYAYSKTRSASLKFNGKKYGYMFYSDPSNSSKRYKSDIWSNGNQKTRYAKEISTNLNRFKAAVDSAKGNSDDVCSALGVSSTSLISGLVGSSLSVGLSAVVGAIGFLGGGIGAAYNYIAMLRDLNDCEFYYGQI